MSETPITCTNVITMVVLLHCYYSSDIPPHSDSKSTQDALKFLMNNEVIYRSANGGYSVTHLGKAWVLALMRVPIPQVAYLDADGTILRV